MPFACFWTSIRGLPGLLRRWRKWPCNAVSATWHPICSLHGAGARAPSQRRGDTPVSTGEQTILQQASDEQLARMYLELSRSGKRGSQMYQRIEAEMRARNLIRREARVQTFYTSSRSPDARPMLF